MKHVGKPFDNSAGIKDLVSAYRLVLGRNPDRSGFEHYKNLIKNHDLSLDQLFSTFIDSPEYRKKHHDANKIREIDCGGYYVCVKRGEKDFGSAIVQNNTWEPHIIHAISKILKKGQTFVDIGANVGVMTFHGAKLVGEAGNVIAVEPNPDNLQLLYRGILKNCARNVHVIPSAASDRKEVFSLAGGTSNTYLTTSEDSEHYVQSIILDQCLHDAESIDLVKIDIEGHEPYALNGLRHLLKLHKPMIIMEFNPRCLSEVSDVSPRECLNMIFELFEDVQTLEHSGKYMSFSDPCKLWKYWEQRNEEAVQTNWLSDGMLHFDLVAKAM